MKNKILVISYLLFAITFSTQAQLNGVLNAASRGAMKAIEKKVEKTTETAVSKKIEEKSAKDSVQSSKNQTNTAEESTEESTGSSSTKNEEKSMPFGGMMASMMKTINAPCEDSYTFSTVIQYVIKTDSVPEMNMEYLFSKDAQFFGSKLSDSLMFVYDNKNKSIVTFITAPEGKTYISMANTEQAKVEETKSTDQPKITKTTQTKTIAGYLCTLYKVASKDFTGEYWITPQLKYNLTSFSTNKEASKNPALNPEFKDGFIMESKGVDSNGYHTFSTIKAINTTANIQIFKKDYKNVMAE